MIFTWHKMASMCAKFHCHTISSLENIRVGHSCPPPLPQIKYATPDTPNKIGLIYLKSTYLFSSFIVKTIQWFTWLSNVIISTVANVIMVFMFSIHLQIIFTCFEQSTCLKFHLPFWLSLFLFEIYMQVFAVIFG